MFDDLDVDKNGKLTIDELLTPLLKDMERMTEDLMNWVDENQGGKITLEEFERWMMGMDSKPKPSGSQNESSSESEPETSGLEALT